MPDRVQRVANDFGWECPDCRRRPEAWWSIACPRCPSRAMVCAGCHATPLDARRAHARSHERPVAAQVTSPLGTAPQQPRVAPSGLALRGARAGAQVGRLRGRRGIVLGGAVGAVVGGLADHVLGHPDVQPAARLARAVYDVLGEIRGALGLPIIKK